MRTAVVLAMFLPAGLLAMPENAAAVRDEVGTSDYSANPRIREAGFPIPGLRDYEKGVGRNVRCGRRLPEERLFFPFVDRFGQNAHETWPGKVGSDSVLRQRTVDEECDLKSRPGCAIPGADRFGGWGEGPQLKATGLFRTEKVNGRWHFVDPDGRLFFSLGVNCVNFSSWTGVTGRENFFRDLPARDDILFASCWGRQKGPSVRGFYHDCFPYEKIIGRELQ